jgi:hypothetical protein
MPTQERGTLRIGFPHQSSKETGESALRIMAFAVTARVSSGPNFTHGWSLTKGFALGRPRPRYNNWPKGSRDQGRHVAPAAKTFYETYISSGAWGLWRKSHGECSQQFVCTSSVLSPTLTLKLGSLWISGPFDQSQLRRCGRNMKRLLIISLSLLVFIQGTFAQNSSLSLAIDVLPQCAVRISGSSGAQQTNKSLQLICLATGIAGSACSATNQTCICTDAPLQKDVALCVTTSCTVKESLSK